MIKFPKFLSSTRLLAVICISLLIHLLVGVFYGGYVIFEKYNPPEPELVAPPIPEGIEPRKKEYKIKMEKSQKQSSAPLTIPIVANIQSDLSLDNIYMNVSSPRSDQKVRGVGSGEGLGKGFGDGYGSGTGFDLDIDIRGFGTTTKIAHAWEGTVYLFKPNGIKKLLNPSKNKIASLRDGKRQSTKIYNYSLNLPAQNFSRGFPGVTDQFEWFAIDFEVKIFWPESLAGEYEFRVASDDGSVLLIDRKVIVDNDGGHAMRSESGKYTLKPGMRRFQLTYYQGPANSIGLILDYRKVGTEEWQIFDLRKLIKYQID